LGSPSNETNYQEIEEEIKIYSNLNLQNIPNKKELFPDNYLQENDKDNDDDNNNKQKVICCYILDSNNKLVPKYVLSS
jgi:hypothetical protein